jgi:hypothetical protein
MFGLREDYSVVNSLRGGVFVFAQGFSAWKARTQNGQIWLLTIATITYFKVGLVGLTLNIIKILLRSNTQITLLQRQRRKKKFYNLDSRSPSFETVYICDTMFNFAAVHFWGGLSECGFDQSTFLAEKSEKTSRRSPGMESRPNVLIFKNLQWRPSSSRGGFFRLNAKYSSYKLWWNCP